MVTYGYILMVLISIGQNRGVTMDTQEFMSLKACIGASLMTKKLAAEDIWVTDVHTACIPKGDPQEGQ